MLRRLLSFVLATAALGALAVVATPSIGGTQQGGTQDQPLPERPAVIEVEMQERQVYRIALPTFAGREPLASQATDVLRHDCDYSSLFQIIDARNYPASAATEGLAITRSQWTGIGAQAVVKAELRGVAPNVELELRLYEVGRVAGNDPTLVRTYTGTEAELRKLVHRFANELVGQITGTPGAFDTQLTFARREQMGRKDVFVADYDGAGMRRISNGTGIAMLPAFGPGNLWYSRLTEFGMYLTHSGMNERPVIQSEGLNMGISICGERMFFTSTRDGNSEIYSAKLDGTDIRRLTRHPAIDVSPACGPNNQLAFVSNRHGGPQVFVMTQDGGEPRRVTFKGSHNQTPSWCMDPQKPLLAFTGRDAGLDIFTVNVNTQAYVRLTQGQGLNKDPAFSPDCRMVAFHSSRQGGGIYLSNPNGFNQNRVVEGHAETLRWSRTPWP